jgi:hypothetical protein
VRIAELRSDLVIVACAISAGIHGALTPSHAITTGVPLLHPHPEPVDGLALATKGIEVVGLLVATRLLRRRVAITHSPKGALT